jgi:hypothetical protein
MAHIEIPLDTPKRTYAVGGTPDAAFDIPFPFFSAADIVVYNGTTLLEAADYTVAGTAVDGGYSSGTVTLDVAVSNTTITVLRDVPPAREDDFPTSGRFNIGVLNTTLDKLFAMAQQLTEKLTRTLTLHPTASGVDPTLPAAVARRALLWDADANAIVNSTYDPDEQVALTAANVTAAATAQTAAELAEASAETAEANAEAAAAAAAVSEANAALSATAAQVAAASNLFATITDITADRLVVNGDNGTMFRVDATGGNVTLTLPASGGVSGDFRIGIARLDGSANSVTILRAGADTIEGGTSIALTQQYDSATVMLNTGTTNWSAIVNPDDGTLARKNVVQSFTRAQGIPFQAGTFGASVAWDLDAMPAMSLATVSSAFAMALPTNIRDGFLYSLRWTQNGTGGYAVTWDAAFKFGDDGEPAWSTTASKTNYAHFIGKGTTELHLVGYGTGY